jgi:hypothetical protein
LPNYPDSEAYRDWINSPLLTADSILVFGFNAPTACSGVAYFTKPAYALVRNLNVSKYIIEYLTHAITGMIEFILNIDY